MVLGYDTLNKFLVPIALPYLATTESKLSGDFYPRMCLDDVFLNSSALALSDECLQLLKYTMGIAAWSKYVSCLDYWLKRLDNPDENQKATIRWVASVVYYDEGVIQKLQR